MSKMREQKKQRKQEVQLKKDERLETVKTQSDTIQRNINRDIQKAQGLVRKRKKEDRNPRKKFRNKFEKAQKKRRTVVQEVKSGP